MCPTSTGEIPDEFGSLRNLQHLELSANNLVGHIPSTIFNISTMRVISLSSNKLSGSLPANRNFRLPVLTELYLGENSFSGTIPDFITQASKLSILELSNNSFTGVIPNTIGNLRNLQRLSLFNNYFTSSTSELSFWSALANCKELKKNYYC